MKKYTDYGKTYIGYSDVAALVVVGIGADSNEMESNFLRFGGDDGYNAYIVDEQTEIPDHYKLVMNLKFWTKIYDDAGLTLKVYADQIKIYRAGEFGVIIQTFGDSEIKPM